MLMLDLSRAAPFLQSESLFARKLRARKPAAISAPILALLLMLLGLYVPGAHAQTCPFDDGNSSLEVEGLILTRYALGITGAPLVASTGINAVDAPTVEATINCPSCGLNVTGNPALTVADATIISRKLAGFSGASLTNGLALGTGTRNTPALVQSFLLSGCGATGGTVTSITAGSGLTGGTITASGTIAADTTFLQRRVAAPCAAGSFITSIGADGTPTCATPSAIIIVAKSGGHFSTISAALTSITDNSATNRYLVYVAPGTYAETVTMKPYVDIEGAGELATKITQVGNASGAPTLSGASNAELRFLTVENTGGFDFAVAIRNVSASPRFTHITASALNGVETDGIKNISSSPKLEHVTVSATSSVGSYGMQNLDSSPTINNSVIAAIGAASFGIYNATTGGSFVVRATNSQIAGNAYTIFTIPSYTTLVVASQLSGGAAGGGGGTVTCIGVYDENFVAPGYMTCP
ncbi:MAG: hypothetical protein ABIZ64_17145 [Casimicrobium sp.]